MYKKNKIMATLIFGRIVVHKERMTERGSYNLVECSSENKQNKSMRPVAFNGMVLHKRKNANERGSYILVKWSCANKRNKSMRTLFFGRLVM